MKSFANSIEMISIPALREVGDADIRIKGMTAKDFYPRPPRGGRP